MQTQPAPKNAHILFDGTDLTGWHDQDGGPAQWDVRDGAMTVVPRAGSIVSNVEFTDAYIHLEFSVPDMPEATGQKKGNSGIFLHDRYEIQVLDSYGIRIPGTGDCGALYSQSAPLVNACKPATEWQSYDIIFRAIRRNDAGEIIEHARVTVLQNGLVVQNNTVLEGPTGSRRKRDEHTSGPLLLQDHNDPVSFRNIWLVHLPTEGSAVYEPR